MVKFGSPYEEGLEKISWKILHIARAASKMVEKNWQEWDNSRRGNYIAEFSGQLTLPQVTTVQHL
jgi:hypothetical protein